MLIDQRRRSLGRFEVLPVADNAEFIPLPPDALQSAGAMS
jgi:hypothetical protein